MDNKRMILCIFGVAVLVILITLCSTLGADQQAPETFRAPSDDIPKPQFFCGYCHILTYPHIINKGHATWQKDKHNKTPCIECHYGLSGQETGDTLSNPVKSPHLNPSPITPVPYSEKNKPAGPPVNFTHIAIGTKSILTHSTISDVNCTTSRCHGKPDDNFLTKKIKFTAKVPFIHQKHLDKQNQIEGQQMHCTTCHQHETSRKHFEVSRETCFLCHFKNTKFDDGRSKCTACHQLPEKPIQTSGEKPITHKMLQDANVPCGSCHYELIKGGGEVKYELIMENGAIKNAMIMGGGAIKPKSCQSCHDEAQDLEKMFDMRLMHQKHVAIKNARCFDCHKPIRHTNGNVVEPIKNACASCHPDHHKFQRLLIQGPKRKGVSETPDRMFVARANCLACHTEQAMGAKGELTLKASGKTCVSCHSKDHDKMLKEWVDELTQELKFANELADEAQQKITTSAGKASEAKLQKARAMLQEGRDDLHIVASGNGVHNRKYAMLLIDAAVNRFDDLIADLEDTDSK